jgi:WD40 repeat protein
VEIYDSVAGALRLSLNLADPPQAIGGSPDGSMLFCRHQGPSSIALWDIQTGGLIHNFILEDKAEDVAISLGGRYLACGMSNRSVKIWEVANRTEHPSFKSGWRVPHLCWLEPEEQLAFVEPIHVAIRDITTGEVLHRFRIMGPTNGIIYSKKLDRLIVLANFGHRDAFVTVDPRKGTMHRHMTDGSVSCFAFSQATNECVYARKIRGMEMFNVTTVDRREFDHPAKITFVSALSNGTAIANAAGSSIQLLSLDGEYASSRLSSISAFSVHTFDQGRIIAVFKTQRDSIALLNAATTSRLHTIPSRGAGAIPKVLCASLQNGIIVDCVEEGEKTHLELWRSEETQPRWSVEMSGLPSIGGISPGGTRLVTFHDVYDRTHVCVRDGRTGRLHAELIINDSLYSHPLEIDFASEDRFYSLYNTYRTPFDLDLREGAVHPILYHKRRLSVGQPRETKHHVDSNNEWVVSGSKRICWIPPGHLKAGQATSCWAGSTLAMVGQDEMLRMFTFNS